MENHAILIYTLKIKYMLFLIKERAFRTRYKEKKGGLDFENKCIKEKT